MKLLFPLTFCLLLTATLEGQSLADFARQERERKKGVQSKVTYTNDSLRPAAAPTVSPSATPATAAVKSATEAKPDSKATTGPTDRMGRDEKTWRAAFAQTRTDLKNAEDQIKILELRMNQAKRDYLEKSDLYNREMVLAAEINNIQKDLDRQRADAEKFKQQLASMEEDLRRSGGPAGWAR